MTGWLEGSEWLGVLASPFIGSFVANAVERYPQGEGFVAGRSRCAHCGATLSAWELIPIVSWLALRGRCRHCGQPIGWRPLVTELSYLAVGAATFAAASGVTFWVGCLLGWVLLALAFIDLRTHLLPDRITLPLIMAGLALSGLAGRDVLFDRALGAALGFLSLYAVAVGYRKVAGRDGLGMGDAKLFAAAGAWLGPSMLPETLFLAAATGLLVECLRRGIRGWRKHSRYEHLAFGPYLALATWAGWVFGPLLPGLS